ncbi:hypothetical protein [Bremerella volcania]|uniref:hypothetical protein n=1 Tax=Bremerella volcania TaxID=2527984 RepID=UPI00119F8700|nr:hypothetical protein [Bremerella volcania]
MLRFIAAFVIFRLAQQIYSTLVAILCGSLILLPLPCLVPLPLMGLLVLLNVNHEALRELNEHGLRPGFLGMSQSAALAQLNMQRAEPGAMPTSTWACVPSPNGATDNSQGRQPLVGDQKKSKP